MIKGLRKGNLELMQHVAQRWIQANPGRSAPPRGYLWMARPLVVKALVVRLGDQQLEPCATELLQTINKTALGLRGRPGGSDAGIEVEAKPGTGRLRKSGPNNPATGEPGRMSPRRVRGLFKKRRGREDVGRAGGSAGGRGGAKREAKAGR